MQFSSLQVNGLYFLSQVDTTFGQVAASGRSLQSSTGTCHYTVHERMSLKTCIRMTERAPILYTFLMRFKDFEMFWLEIRRYDVVVTLVVLKRSGNGHLDFILIYYNCQNYINKTTHKYKNNYYTSI